MYCKVLYFKFVCIYKPYWDALDYTPLYKIQKLGWISLKTGKSIVKITENS
jgi:hypothetical protein